MASFCILGGSGFVGSRLVTHLANAGHRVLVPTRDPERCRHLWVLPTVRVVQADVGSPAALAGLLAGADLAVNLVGILNEPGRDGSGFRRAHVTLTATLLEACRATGVKRLIQLSALNAGATGATSHYLRSKGEAEALIRDSGLDWTILQPSVIFGPRDSFLNRFAGLLRRVPLVFPLAMPDARFTPVHVDDVVAALTRVAGDPSTRFATLPLCGPDAFTLREIVALVAGALGLRRRIIGLPHSLSRLQAAVLQYFPGKPFSPDNYRSLLLDSVGTTDGLQRLGITPRALEPNVATALSTAGLPRVIDRYRGLARR